MPQNRLIRAKSMTEFDKALTALYAGVSLFLVVLLALAAFQYFHRRHVVAANAWNKKYAAEKAVGHFVLPLRLCTVVWGWSESESPLPSGG